MNEQQLRERFPRASDSFIRANSDPGLHPTVPEQNAREALVRLPEREAAGAGRPQERYRVTYTVFSCRPMDWDNLAASLKALQDCLIEEGFLPDDNWEVLEGRVISRKCRTRAEQRTEVLIERL